MKKAFLVISFFILLTATVYSSSGQLQAASPAPQSSTPIDPVFPGLGIITSRTMADGRLATSNQAVFGPNSCIDYGDPYSPLNSPYAPGYYTYQFRIRIPADYPSDIVRVELFDPDSINQAANSFDIARSNIAINNGFSALASKTCGFDGGSTNQTNPCLMRTDELELVTGAPNLDLNEVNPYWFVRIDENRGTGNPPGDGTCGSPSTYTPAYNTSTLFELAYYHQGESGAEKIPLVSYIGQTGDNVRDAGDHNTDMRWVSPGAEVPFSAWDTPGNLVPAIPATIDSFEVNLTTDVPNILVDARTGDRYLYLEVTTLSGASENGYEIWAGPPDYVNSVPSDVNARNLYILNNPGSHDSQGVEITAVNTLLQNSNHTEPVDIPLAYIGPEAAGQTIPITLFDTDSGAQPPWIFYFDTIAFTPDDSNPLGYNPALTDWAMAFGVPGQDDPDGVAAGVRCLPGSCQSQWVEPAYQITIPGDLSNCDWQNPTPETCTPFYGGRLMVRMDGGFSDTYAWQLPLIEGELPDNSTAGCSAFPIGIHEGVRSVTAPGIGSYSYPDAADFTYPLAPPTYESFIDHDDDVPLLNAKPGDVFRVYTGSGLGNFGWLVWNQGIFANAATLANSLAWPGDSTDYSDHNDGGSLSPINGWGGDYVPRGYIEPGNVIDQALHIGDWIAADTGAINSSDIRDQLATHIDLERTLRLPVWNTSTGIGSDTLFQTSQFGLFRLVGYNLSTGWLLLEFEGFDTSCGQLVSTVSTTFNPVADASVLANRPTSNLGSRSQLRLDATPTMNSYLRFDVQSLTGTVNSATLRLFVDTTSSVGFTAHEVTDNSWAEDGITFDNAPAIGTVINSSGATTAGSYVEVDVTSYITGNGLASLALTTTDTSLIAAQSREGANPPELIVETTAGGGEPPSLSLMPNCAAGPDVQFNVLGDNWPSDKSVTLSWEGSPQVVLQANQHSGSFAFTWAFNGLADGVYTVSGLSGVDGATASATFTIPCEGSPTATPTPTNTAVPPTPTPTATASPTPIAPTPTFTPTPRCDIQFEGEAVAGNNFVFVTGDVGVDVTVSNLSTGASLGSGTLGGPFAGHACQGFGTILLNPPLDSDNIGDILLAVETGAGDNNDTTIVVGATPTPIATNTPTPTNTPTATATATASPTPDPGGSTFTFSSAEDAIVLSNRPTSNYGAATILGTDDSPDMLSYLKFNVAGLDGSVVSATLRVFVTTAVSPFNIAQVADNNWSQTSLTYNTAPATGSIINNSGAISSNSWVEIDVTSAINGDGTFSLALLADAAGRNLFSSSESGSGPELVVVTGP